MTVSGLAASWLCAFSILALFESISAAGTKAWKTRSVYQVMTDRFARTDGSTTASCDLDMYCGGTWKGLINHLDYIQGMGFDAVMISPIVKNVEGKVSYGEAYHGYWVDDMNSLNSHFGTHQDLLDLSNALHSRGMFLMMDTVVNNMAYITNGSDPATSVDYPALEPFNNAQYYHPYCKITDYNDYPLAQRCWTGDDIVPLPDLKTEDPTVQQMLTQWLQDTMTTYSVDGLRLDAAKHVTPEFLPVLGNAASSFMTGEVYDYRPEIICNYTNDYITSVPNYPIWNATNEAFTLGNPKALADQIQVMKSTCRDPTVLASFSENHDIRRFGNYTHDMALAKNVLTFTLLFDGIPIIYQGQEQHFTGGATPSNREPLWQSGYDTTAPLYLLAAKLNMIRKHALQIDPSYVDIPSYPLYTGGSELVVRKGNEGRQIIMVLSTQGENGGRYTVNLPITFGPGMVVTDILNCVNYTVDGDGNLEVIMDRGEPRVLFPTDKLAGSGLCGNEYFVSNLTMYAAAATSRASGLLSRAGFQAVWSRILLLSFVFGIVGLL